MFEKVVLAFLVIASSNDYSVLRGEPGEGLIDRHVKLRVRVLDASYLPDLVTSRIQYKEKPIPLELALTFSGDRAITLKQNPFDDLEIAGDIAWVPRTRLTEGETPERRIAVKPTNVLKATVYAQSYFRELSLGVHKLKVKVTVTPLAGEPIVCSDETSIEIQDATEKTLDRDFERILRQLRKESRPWMKIGITKSIAAHVDSPKAIPLLIESLRFQADHIQRLHELCSKYNDWTPLVDYLVENGTYRDIVHFQSWEKQSVVLPEKLLGRLIHSRMPWVRLFAYTTFGEDYLRDNQQRELEFLEFEYQLIKMTESAARLKRQLGITTQLPDPNDEILLLRMLK